MRRMLWWGEGSAKGEAGQVGLEGCGEAPGLSPEGTGELWQILEQGKVRFVFWKGLSGCLMWEFGGCWGRDPGGRVPRDQGRDPAFGGRAVEGEEAACAGALLPVLPGLSQATRSSRV